MNKEMTIKLELILPPPQDYIMFKTSNFEGAEKEEHQILPSGAGTVPIESLSESEAYKYANMLSDSFIKNWKEKTGVTMK